MHKTNDHDRTQGKNIKKSHEFLENLAKPTTLNVMVNRNYFQHKSCGLQEKRHRQTIGNSTKLKNL
jgi:hypothetical protein